MRKMTFFVILLIQATYIFSQNYEQAENNSALDYSNILVQQSSFFNLTEFETVYGEKLSNKELLSRLKLVPENSDLLKKERLFRVLDYSFIGLSFMGWTATTFGSQINNGKQGELIEDIGSIMMVSSLCFALLSGNIAVSKRQRAVDNYNLYILGLPIR